MANLYLCDAALILQQKHILSQQDVKICIMTMLKLPNKNIALKLYRSEQSISKMRSRTAQKLGTDSTHMRAFLIDLLAKQ